MFIQNAVSPAPDPLYFGASGNIPSGSGSFVEFDSYGYSTAAFRINVPSQGLIQFQGTFDGINYNDITFRQIGNDGYSQESFESADYIGSIIGTRKLRFLNVTGALNSGSVMGTLSKNVSILEGVEHNNPPHKFGNVLFHIGVNVSGNSFSNSGLFFPQPRHKFAVSYLAMSVSSQAGAYITFHEGSGTSADASQWVFSTYIKASSNDTQFMNAVLNTPYVSSNARSGLFLTVEGNALLRGVVHGYETE